MKNYDIRYVFNNVNEWLKFAEAKNGILIAFDGAALWALVSLLDGGVLYIPITYYIYLSLFLLTISVIILLYSFIPQFSLEDKKVVTDIDKLNLTYFFDLGKLDYKKFEKKLSKDFSLEIGRFERDLLVQIINNSKIAVFKYSCFKIAVWFNLSALLTPVILLYPLIKYLISEVKK